MKNHHHSRHRVTSTLLILLFFLLVLLLVVVLYFTGPPRQTYTSPASPVPDFYVEPTKPAVNILMPGWNKALTGGPLSILQVASRMSQHGIPVRILNVMDTPTTGREVKTLLSKYNLEPLVHHAEFVEYEDKDRVHYSDKDMFMATLYTTVPIASSMQKKLNSKPILYMIQDCEPFFFAHNSESAKAYASYDVPHIPIFNSWLLQRYFQHQKLSVYSGLWGPFPAFTYFPEYSSSADPVLMQKKKGQKKNFIVYGRPHIDRNAYAFTMQCLEQAVQQQKIDPSQWNFYNVGGSGDSPKGLTLQNLSHIDGEAYLKLLTTGDIGLSLMMSPHPSLPPFDFASAGMLVVTNSLFERTPEEYEKVSQNFFVGRTSVDALEEQLAFAVAKVDDVDFRIQGSYLNLPSHSIDYVQVKKQLEV